MYDRSFGLCYSTHWPAAVSSMRPAWPTWVWQPAGYQLHHFPRISLHQCTRRCLLQVASSNLRGRRLSKSWHASAGCRLQLHLLPAHSWRASADVAFFICKRNAQLQM